MVYAGYGVVGYVFVRGLAPLAGGVAYWMLARRLLPAFHLAWGFDVPTLRRVRSYLGFGTINRVVSGLVGRLDQTLIAIWLGVAAAGVYAVPFMVTSSLSYMIAYMLGFIFPLSSELFSQGQTERLLDIFARAARFISALGSMAFVPLFVFGDLFLTVWVGPSVAGQVSRTLRLLAVSGYLATITVGLANSVAVGIGLIRQFTIYNVMRAVILGVGCLLLIHPFGLQGAALALLLCNVADLIFLVFVIKRHLLLSVVSLLRSSYSAPMALGLALGGGSYFLRPIAHSWIGLALAVGIFELFYIALGYRTGVFGTTERRALEALWHLGLEEARRTGKT
jgi:O-antigen/teichoic acid export membrane protein